MLITERQLIKLVYDLSGVIEESKWKRVATTIATLATLTGLPSTSYANSNPDIESMFEMPRNHSYDDPITWLENVRPKSKDEQSLKREEANLRLAANVIRISQRDKNMALRFYSSIKTETKNLINKALEETGHENIFKN